MVHLAATVGRKTYLWGGRTKDFSEKSREKLGSVVETFDPYLEQWEQQPTKGAPPPGLYNGACASLMDSMYICAGTDEINYYSSLHQLNTTTLKWSESLQQNPKDGPMRKVGCGMISYNDDTLALFGGFGISSSELQSVIKSRQFPDGRRWTDEFHLFDIKKGVFQLHLILQHSYLYYRLYYIQVSGALPLPLGQDLLLVQISPSLRLITTELCCLGEEYVQGKPMISTSLTCKLW